MSTDALRRNGGSFRAPEMALLTLFFFSGAVALVYEVVWTRDLTYVFGGSAFAIATVLAAFMAGLALGSKILGGMIDRRGHPLKVYAVLELGIGLFALLLPVLFGWLDGIYAAVYRNWEPGFQTLGLVRFALTFVVLLVPTTLMGGTLPVLGKLLLRSGDRIGLRAGVLYGVNTFGAVVGVAAGGFVLLPALGLHTVTVAAVIANLLIAALAWGLAGRFPETSAFVPGAQPESNEQAPSSPRLRRTVLVVYGLSGMAALALEVAWTKTLSMVLGTTTYAFTSMLTTFLLGLALGSAVFSRVADRYQRPLVLLVLVQAGIPLLALASVPLLGQLPQWFVDGFAANSASWVRLELFRVALAASIMFLPAFFMGGAFPLISRVYLGREKTGSALGSLYAANTVGAIVGSFATGFVLIPWLGRQSSLVVAGSLGVAAALLLATAVPWKATPRVQRFALAAIFVALVPAFFVATRPWDKRVLAAGAYVYADQYTRKASVRDAMKGNHLLYYDEGAEGTVSVWRREQKTHLRIQGKVDASSHGDMITQKLLAHLPALYHRGEIENGLVIGLGSGVSVGSLLSYNPKRVDTAELIPGMADAARYFADVNGGAMDDPRHHLLVTDGRNHLKLTDRKYDVIVSEPSNPWIAGIGSLFTQEFFASARERLREGGVLSQWVQIYDFSEDDLRTILATLAQEFPHVHVWMGSPGDLILLASESPLSLDEARVRALLEDGAPGDDLASVEILPLEQLLGCFVTDGSGVEALAGDWPKRVTDDNLYLEYAVPRHMVAKDHPVRFETLTAVRTSPAKLMGAEAGGELAATVARYRAARDRAYLAHYHAKPGMDVVAELHAAHAMEPGEQLSRKLWGKVMLNLGLGKLAAGNGDEAAAAFVALEREGLLEHRSSALLHMGTLAHRQGDDARAAALWRECLEREPGYPEAWFFLGGMEAKAGRLPSAMKHYVKATTLAPDYAAAWVAQADLHARGQAWDLALGCAERALEADAENLDARVVRGVAWMQTGKAKAAAGEFAAVTDNDPTRSAAYYNLAVAQEELHRFTDASETWRRYLQLKPGDARASASLAWILATRLEKPAEAERLARASLAGAPSANGYDTLAESLYRQNKQQEAVAAARAAYQLDGSEYYREQLARFGGGAGN